MNTEKIVEEFEKAGFYTGRMISGSKSFYVTQYPECVVYFNCNVFVKGLGKVWYGDLDITKSGAALKKITEMIGPFYVLREMDGRFLEKELTDKEIVAKSVWDTTKDIPQKKGTV